MACCAPSEDRKGPKSTHFHFHYTVRIVHLDNELLNKIAIHVLGSLFFPSHLDTCISSSLYKTKQLILCNGHGV